MIPNNGKYGIEKLADQLKDYIEKHIPANEHFILVGFSMGNSFTLLPPKTHYNIISTLMPYSKEWLLKLKRCYLMINSNSVLDDLFK